ncbi:MAG TPA: metal-sensitive transcriptional regulator [Verrucomicrobiae bacterium]|nr:metal-sensitive transcriptional regulator [Verrucomicrobiae bacterium]
MHKAEHKRRKEVLDRLARIEGHVHGLKKMVNEDKTCPEILLQVAAIRAALNKVSRIVLEDHMETCMKEAVSSGDTEQHIEELKEALSKLI